MCIRDSANRPETDTLEGALYHIQTIQAETGLKMKGLISNTHLLRCLLYTSDPQEIVDRTKKIMEVK